MAGGVRPCKVWNFDRSLKKSITASSLQELIEKGCSKLGLNQTTQLRVVLEEDGTEVDEEDYFSLLPRNTAFLFLQNNEQWRPGGADSASRDEPDTSNTTSIENDHLMSLIDSLKCDVANIITFSAEELQQLVDHDTSQLAELMGRSDCYIQTVQAACQGHLDELAQANEVADILKLFHRARSSSGSPIGKKQKVDHDKETAIRFLQRHGVIHQQRFCNNGHQMTLSTVSDRWRCNARQCRQEIGLRKGTWLQRSRMEFRTVILFIYCWSKNLATIKFCSEELSIGHTTAVEWKNFLREICAWRLLQTPTIVGGPGLHVEIDETLISRCKNHAGRVLPQQWIFGGICQETKEVFMYAVPDRTAATLLDTIQACIAPGSIIISDMWASYQGIEAMIGMKYTHQTVNHTENFVDSMTGAHTQTIKSFWHVNKMQNKRQCGTYRSLVDSYFCEFVWRQRYRNTDLFMQIITDISQFHPLQ